MTRILLVDDDDAIAEVAGAGLVQRGFEVRRAANGVEALAEFERHRPDVVITDLVMPQKEGWSLIGELRQRDPRVRIIAMTGGGLDTPQTYLKLARQLGAAAALQKPFTIEQLLGAIARLDEPAPVEPRVLVPRRFRPKSIRPVK